MLVSVVSIADLSRGTSLSWLATSLQAGIFSFAVSLSTEHWVSDSGTLVDEQTGVRFVHVGHSADKKSKSGKHGVGFLVSWKARGLWIS